eukprot:TRINITY_DN10292_c0_g1_i1.p1 TRINITY_DN10292_c0_g1~~TRINITY_DN10292_c0_g1_i1.p1  ORF type:complete len:243 (+),score=30.85 TRINITY_DN10292_c0_g1_i1:70-798(+)
MSKCPGYSGNVRSYQSQHVTSKVGSTRLPPIDVKTSSYALRSSSNFFVSSFSPSTWRPLSVASSLSCSSSSSSSGMQQTATPKKSYSLREKDQRPFTPTHRSGQHSGWRSEYSSTFSVSPSSDSLLSSSSSSSNTFGGTHYSSFLRDVRAPQERFLQKMPERTAYQTEYGRDPWQALADLKGENATQKSSTYDTSCIPKSSVLSKRPSDVLSHSNILESFSTHVPGYCGFSPRAATNLRPVE